MPQTNDTPTTAPGRRRALLAGAGALVIGATAPAAASATTVDAELLALVAGASPGTANPDAELIRLCAEHPALLDAYNRDGGYVDCEVDPLWHAYSRSRDAIGAAQPRTLAGMLAKARAAKAEAALPGGREQPECTPAERWAWDLVNDLLRLHGEAAA